MTQITGTYDTYDQIGIREDLTDVIHMISPEDTPFYSACKKVKATQTLHEWQTDTLRPSADNKHIEGDETSFPTRDATTRLGNRTQIFKDAVIIPDTDEGVVKAGRGREMAYQVMKIAAEQKLDIERALFLNNAAVAGSSSVARELAGATSWILTNAAEGSGSTPSSGDGSDERSRGSLTAFSQSKFDGVMQSCWVSGGKPDRVYLSAYQMNIALGFEGNNNQRATIQASGKEVMNVMDFYVTPWGRVLFVPSRECASQDVFVMQSDKWKCAVLRGTKNVALGKSGDASKRQVVTELTLEACNEAASGAVYDNSIS